MSLGSREVEAPRFPDNRLMKMVVSSPIGPLQPPGNIPGTYFFRVSVESRAIVRPEGLSQQKIQMPHRESNPRL
jgi:hypothetical protein